MLSAGAWCLATVSHFLLTARWVNRAGGALVRDERWFQTVVMGTAGLSAALHVIAATIGLSLGAVLIALMAGHGLVAWMMANRRPAGAAPPETDRVTRALETAAILALIAVVVQWTVLAVPTAEVSGTDAAHYHVPNAVNLALGASPFDLPPTSHLYPMGASMLAAWFILPLQTTLLTDLVMVLPFLLLLSSAAWLFRQLTSLSGLAWSTWPMLALFGTPLFRYASLMSADLLFTASTVALAAALLAPIGRRQVRPSDLLLIAMSLGLLLGAKTTGVIVAILLGVPAAIAFGIQRFRKSPSVVIPSGAWAGAALAVIAAGGIWLLRNWWVWGSPVAPNNITLFGITLFSGAAFEPTTYNSVLGDMVEKADYRLWTQARHYMGIWLGSWYLAIISLMVLVPIDAVAGWRRVEARPLIAARLGTLTVAAGTTAVMVWFLIGAPWTSLEWTKGLSLRYAMPCLALLPLVAWVSLFPVSLPWYRRTPLATLGGIVTVVAGVAVFAGHQQPSFPPMPTAVSMAAALATLGAMLVIHPATSRRASGVAAAAVLAVSVGFGSWASQADARAQEARAAAIAAGPRTRGERLYGGALAFEARDGHPCSEEGRRFFVTNRFDEPSALQGSRLENQVFYAGRDVQVTSAVRPAMGPCDYLITERAVMNTKKGAALHGALNTSGRLAEVVTIDDVVLLVHR